MSEGSHRSEGLVGSPKIALFRGAHCRSGLCTRRHSAMHGSSQTKRRGIVRLPLPGPAFDVPATQRVRTRDWHKIEGGRGTAQQWPGASRRPVLRASLRGYEVPARAPQGKARPLGSLDRSLHLCLWRGGGGQRPSVTRGAPLATSMTEGNTLQNIRPTATLPEA